MKFIDKIIISKFRSFGKDEEINCGDINVFSGGNDTGKSNLLKALNLFFNNKTDLINRFNPDHDFNKWFRDNNERGERNIVIRVYFKPGKYYDPKKNNHLGINNGFIAEKIFGIGGSIEVKYYYLNNTLVDEDSKRKASSVIENKIKYVYIPAIRGLDFRSNIQRELMQVVQNKDNSQLLKAFEAIGKEIDITFTDLKVKFNQNSISTNFFTQVDFYSLLDSLKFYTDEQIIIKKRGRNANHEKQSISISNRGDGIQMQFFSFLLWFITEKDDKAMYIWGFEEPEIAFELKKQYDLAEIFKREFSKNAQLFLTTHSPAFAFLENDNNVDVRTYRVSYEKDTASRGNRIVSKTHDLNKYCDELFESDSKNDLSKDIWGTNIQKLYYSIGQIVKESDDFKITFEKISELKIELAKEKTKREAALNANVSLNKRLTALKPQKIFICEDEDGVAIWKDLFLKYGIDINEIEFFSSRGCTNNSVENYIETLNKKENTYQPYVFRQLDLDGFEPKQVEFIQTKKQKKHSKHIANYTVQFLPVNEIENFILINNDKVLDEHLLNHSTYPDLHDAISLTIENNLNVVRSQYFDKKTTDEEKNMFNRKSKMIEEARKEPRKLFTGKDICNKLNIDYKSSLKNMSIEDYPAELLDYLEKIKKFFNPS